jgi:saccharopine dehydrogenase-like NADP-dependent oxidoreductase
MRVIVLGGAGDMGRRAAQELAAEPDVEGLGIGDLEGPAAQAAKALASPRVRAVPVDARDREGLVRALEGWDVVASAIGPFYEFEARCAAAAIEARKPYVSICDDFDAAQDVFLLDARARAHGVTVLSGLGWTPGVTNLLARRAAASLDRVEEIRVAWASSAADSKGHAVVLHTLHIFSGLVPSFEDGRPVRVAAGSGRERVRFPEPVGEVDVFHVGHPEPVTLPRSFPDVQRVTLKGGLVETFLSDLAIGLARLGLASTPRRRALLRRAIEPLVPVLGRVGRPGSPCSAARVDVVGTQGGRPARVCCGAAAHMPVLTGVPLALGALMLGRRQISCPGVVAPEACIDPDPFLAELARRGIALFEGEPLDKRLAFGEASAGDGI